MNWGTRGIYLGFTYVTGTGRDSGKVGVIYNSELLIFKSMETAEKFMEKNRRSI